MQVEPTPTGAHRLGRGLADHLGLDDAGAPDVAREQGAIADEVDEAGDSAGEAVHRGEGPGGEGDLARAPGHGQAVPHVVVGLLPGQRGQVVARGDALGELAQVAPRQHLGELRLADEHDLDQLVGVGLEVRDEADLFEDLGGEILGLVDEEDDVLTLGSGLQEEAVQGVHQLLERRALAGGVQVVEDRLQQLGGGEGGVEDDRRRGAFG